MEQIIARIKEVKELRQLANDAEECAPSEEADTYGFSLINPHQFSEDASIIRSFEKDENWNNPASVMWMSNFYGVDGEAAYESLLIQPFTILPHYANVRDEQYKSFAASLVAESKEQLMEGNLKKSIKTLTEAIRLDPKSTEALHLRAAVYLKSGNRELAQADYSTISGIRIAQNTDRNNTSVRLDGSDRANLIQKLQSSINDDKSSLKSVNSSDEQSSDSSCVTRNKRSKKKRKHKKEKEKKKHKKSKN